MNVLYFWQTRRFLNLLLLPLTLIWLALGAIRVLFTKTYKSPCFVICVGNINIGGAGKTPTCIWLGKSLAKTNYKAAFLSRGYKGSIKNPTLITHNHSFQEAGDEPLLLREVLPTCVAKNYAKGAKYLEKLGYQIIIMDDGYQNPSIYKNYSLLVINGSFGFGNELLIPAGPLRENIKSGLKKADDLLIIGESNEKLEETISLNNLKNNTYYGKYKVVSSEIIKSRQNIIAFCGIAMPMKFIATLKHLQFKVIKFEIFPDHHNYKEQELNNIIEQSKKYSALVVTTTKDYTKIPETLKPYIKAIEIQLEVNNSYKLINKITNIIENGSAKKKKS